MRKSGFFPRLALVNLMRNGRFYGPYLLSCGMRPPCTTFSPT